MEPSLVDGVVRWKVQVPDAAPLARVGHAEVDDDVHPALESGIDARGRVGGDDDDALERLQPLQ